MARNTIGVVFFDVFFVFVHSVMINSLMNELSSFGAISFTGIDSSFSLKNSLSKATFCSVFFLVLFSCPSINSSTEVISANLEYRLKKTPWFAFCLLKSSVKGGKTDTFFVKPYPMPIEATFFLSWVIYLLLFFKAVSCLPSIVSLLS